MAEECGVCLLYTSNVAKGIEQKTLLRMSQIAADHIDMDRYVVLSGPSHAEEVGRRLPTTVAAASYNIEAAEKVQEMCIRDRGIPYSEENVVEIIRQSMLDLEEIIEKDEEE